MVSGFNHIDFGKIVLTTSEDGNLTASLSDSVSEKLENSSLNDKPLFIKCNIEILGEESKFASVLSKMEGEGHVFYAGIISTEIPALVNIYPIGKIWHIYISSVG